MLVSIIIPCKTENENLKKLLESIKAQELGFDKEVITISNVSPSGSARNQGADKAKGEVLIFLDNDISFGDTKVLAKVIAPLDDVNIGVCGVSQKIPQDANAFQKRCAKEMPHTEHPIVSELEERGMVGGACCALKKDFFVKIGGFNNKLKRGVDVEFCARVKNNNKKVVIAPNAWIYHPPPENLSQFRTLCFRNGKATAFIDRHYPELNFDIGVGKRIEKLEKKSMIQRMWRFSVGVLKSIIFLKPLNLIYRITYSLGYLKEKLFGRRKDVR
ncbi:MAG: glycosyltransferase [PVC group bacterium]|nr:glycosyltransferase [PVC group bacterium]